MIAETMTTTQTITAALIGDDIVQALASVDREQAATLNATLGEQGLPEHWQWVVLDDLLALYDIGQGFRAEYYMAMGGNEHIAIDRKGYISIIDQMNLHPSGEGDWEQHTVPQYGCFSCELDAYVAHSEVAI